MGGASGQFNLFLMSGVCSSLNDDIDLVDRQSHLELEAIAA
jgi:hypothetical protein